MMHGRLLKLSVALVLASSLAGCAGLLAPAILGGAAVGTVLVSTDRRTSGSQLEDEGIELKGAARLREAYPEQRVHVNISSYNRQVLLTGEVPTLADSAKVESLIKAVENVSTVVNELAILGNASMQSRSSDTLITARVKAGLVDDKELHANAFKVLTERGNVYLMGRVTEKEALKATEIARRQTGVLRVVRVLELISEAEKERIQPKPAPAPAETGPTPVFSGTGQAWNAQPAK